MSTSFIVAARALLSPAIRYYGEGHSNAHYRNVDAEAFHAAADIAADAACAFNDEQRRALLADTGLTVAEQALILAAIGYTDARSGERYDIAAQHRLHDAAQSAQRAIIAERYPAPVSRWTVTRDPDTNRRDDTLEEPV